MTISRQILYDHFQCTQLNIDNMVKISNLVVQRMDFESGINMMSAVLTNNGINERICDKTNSTTH